MHIDDEDLLRHALNQLEAKGAERVAEHLRSCESCRWRQENISSIVFGRTVPAVHLGTPTQPDGPDALQNNPSAGLQRGVTLGRYVLLELLGTHRTLWAACLVNGLVGIVALIAAVRSRP